MKYTNDTSRIYAISLFAISIIGFISAFSSKFYSADGANYLLNLLLTEELYTFQDGRIFAHYLLKIPAWLAIKLGVTNFSVVSFLMGIAFYLQIILSLTISRWFLTEKYKNIIIFPILSVFVLVLNTEYAIESESITLACFFWPVYLYLLCKEEKSTYAKQIVFIFLALLLPYTYETFFVCSIPLIWFIYKKSNLISKTIFIPYYFLSSIHQFYNVIFHEHSTNTSNFVSSIYPGFFGLTPWGNINLLNISLLGSFLLFGFFIWLILNNIDKKVNYFFLYLCSVVVFVVVILNPYTLSSYSQYCTRTLTSISPLFFVLIIHLLNRKDLYHKVTRYNRLIVLIVLFQCSISFLSTYHWTMFKNNLNQSLASNQGVYKVVKRELYPYKYKNFNFLANFQIWSLPAYSLFLSDTMNIDSIAYFWDNDFMTKAQLKSIKDQTNLKKYGFRFNYE
jgi:hypothetical protein